MAVGTVVLLDWRCAHCKGALELVTGSHGTRRAAICDRCHEVTWLNDSYFAAPIEPSPDSAWHERRDLA
jgi:hypothetical protein